MKLLLRSSRCCNTSGRPAGIRTTIAQINTLPLGGSPATPSPYDRQVLPHGSTECQPLPHLPWLRVDQPGRERNQLQLHSLQAGIRMENRHGLTTQVAYTWSHNISRSSVATWMVSPIPSMPATTAVSDTGFDRRHIFNVSYIYALPFMKSSSILAREVAWRLVDLGHHCRGSPELPVSVAYSGPDTLGLAAAPLTVLTSCQRSVIQRQ